MKGIFITGSDTHVGKTYIGCNIASRLSRQGINVLPRKPIETGCELVNGKLVPHDAQSLLKASQTNIPLDQVCPYRYAPAISPHMAVRQSSESLSLQQLVNACCNKVNESDFLLIEGAGGFYSPLCKQMLNADLATALQLPVVLVINDKLGAINQALLTISAIKQQQLDIYAVVLSSSQSSAASHQALNNAEEIRQFTEHPIYVVRFGESLPDAFFQGLPV